MTNAYIRQLMIEAFAAGFASSGEGYNGEWSSKENAKVYIGNAHVPFTVLDDATAFAAEKLARKSKMREWK